MPLCQSTEDTETSGEIACYQKSEHVSSDFSGGLTKTVLDGNKYE